MDGDPWSVLATSLTNSKTKKRKKHRISCGRCSHVMHLHKHFYVCPNCKSRHKAHADGKPTGIPADRLTARARIEAHKVFDQMWKSGNMTRSQAYVTLKRIMGGITIEEAHIGRFTYEQCQHLITTLSSPN